MSNPAEVEYADVDVTMTAGQVDDVLRALLYRKLGFYSVAVCDQVRETTFSSVVGDCGKRLMTLVGLSGVPTLKSRRPKTRFSTVSNWGLCWTSYPAEAQ